MTDDTRLNILVAEHVMGWTLETVIGSITWWHDADGKIVSVRSEWEPATDIGDAWQVVEKLRADGWTLALYSPYAQTDEGLETSHQWTAVLDHADKQRIWYKRPTSDTTMPYPGAYVNQDTAPRAICVASLRAVGVTVDAAAQVGENHRTHQNRPPRLPLPGQTTGGLAGA